MHLTSFRQLPRKSLRAGKPIHMHSKPGQLLQRYWGLQEQLVR
ncbi:Unknown protein sequence [Pseudomonas syringae pv. aceris]|nr:Unknown protein sequence [Pseudomonas syringae pv. aceris]